MGQFHLSPAAFNPINPHGSRAKMPRGYVSPMSVPVYQVRCWDDVLRAEIAVTPAMQSDVATDLLAMITDAIRFKRITGWSDPHLVRVDPHTTL